MRAHHDICTNIIIENIPQLSASKGDNHHQCKLIAIVDDRQKTPPALVAEGEDHLGH